MRAMLLDTIRRSIGTAVPFSARDLAQLDPGFRQVRGWYVFADAQVDLPLLFDVGCQAYSPAYVSLEAALSWYELVPETVQAITLVGTRKTRTSESVWRSCGPRELSSGEGF
jgi:hypothetical protein